VHSMHSEESPQCKDCEYRLLYTVCDHAASTRMWTCLPRSTGVLLLVSAFNISGDKESVNLLVTLSAIVGALAVFGLSGRVYKSWYLNALEVSFLLNLSILTAATHHVNLVNGDQAAVAYVSIGMAFLIFVGIITYHIYLRMKSKLQHLRRYFTKSYRNHASENEIIVENSNAQNHQKKQPGGPTMTFLDLRSPLDVINSEYVLM